MSIDKLFTTPAFTEDPAHRKTFRSALKQCSVRQARRFPALARLYAREGFSPASLSSEKSVESIPFLFVTSFKEFDFPASDAFKPALELTSSGTSGQKSRIRLDAGSLRRVTKSARTVYGELGMVDESLKTNYLCMTYDPRAARDLGTAFTDELLTSFTARSEVFYALRPDGRGGFYFDLDGVMGALERFALSGLPLRVLGFPAHVKFARDEWKRRTKKNLRFGRKSWVMTGGGWKGHQGVAIPKDEFRDEISSWLGIPTENVRDLYGLVEHGIPYVECRRGKMHIPNYARVYPRNPQTLEIVSRGKGLLHLVTPYLTSYPSYSVLTSDWGEVKERCGCGVPGKILILHGRAAKATAKGCALSALELLPK